jgi:hypothetical protein
MVRRMTDLLIDALLRDEGFVKADARAAARGILEAAGLTRPRKERMAAEKLDRVRTALDQAAVRHCADPSCAAAVAGDGRVPLEVDKPHCSICSGSNNRRALRSMVDACLTAGIRRVLIVGGRPPAYVELERELAALDLRFVDGTSNLPNQTDALRDCAWAQLLVIWAPTPLPHKVSSLYRFDVCHVAHRVTVHRRGLEALGDEVVKHLRGRAA